MVEIPILFQHGDSVFQCYVLCRAVIAESEKRNIAGVLGEEIQTLHIQNRGLQDEVGM